MKKTEAGIFISYLWMRFGVLLLILIGSFISVTLAINSAYERGRDDPSYEYHHYFWDRFYGIDPNYESGLLKKLPDGWWKEYEANQ